MFVFAILAWAVTLLMIGLLADHLQYSSWAEASVNVAVASAIVGMLIFVATCAVDILKARARPEA